MTTEVQLAVQEREVSLNLQIWKSYVDEVAIMLIDPSAMLPGGSTKNGYTEDYSRRDRTSDLLWRTETLFCAAGNLYYISSGE